MKPSGRALEFDALTPGKRRRKKRKRRMRRTRRKVYLAYGNFSIGNSFVPRGGNLWQKAHLMVSGSRKGGLGVPTSPSGEHLQLHPSQD